MNSETSKVWTIRAGRAESSAELFAILLETASNTTRSAAGNPSALFSFEAIDVAERLNSANVKLLKPLRRSMRKQGRINRMLCEGSAEMADAIGRLGLFADAELKAKLYEGFAKARHLNHSARGSPLARRIRRPQDAFNASLNDAISILAGLVMNNKFKGLDDAAFIEKCEHLRWHIKEVRHQLDIVEHRPALLRRIMRNQYEINRCQIISLQLIRDILADRN